MADKYALATDKNEDLICIISILAPLRKALGNCASMLIMQIRSFVCRQRVFVGHSQTESLCEGDLIISRIRSALL